MVFGDLFASYASIVFALNGHYQDESSQRACSCQAIVTLVLIFSAIW